MTALLVAAAAAAAAVASAAAIATSPMHGQRQAPVPRLWPMHGSAQLLVIAVVAATAVAASLPPGHGMALAVAGFGAFSLRRRSRAARRVRLERRRLAEACLVLSTELRAGRTPGTALLEAAAVSPGLLPAGRAAAAGQDPGPALSLLAAESPASRRLLVAWQVSTRTGASLAQTVERVADDLAAAVELDRLVAEETAPARATARVLAALPVVALLASASIGFEVGDALRSVLGQAALVLGVALAVVGVAWIDRLAARAGSSVDASESP